MEGWLPAPEHAILYAAKEHNILTITSKCNVHCIFCSHRQNPPGVTTYYVEEQSLDKIKEWTDFLDGNKKIIIGESATKISEGEPFTHSQVVEILCYLREKFPNAPLQLTTNGSLLTEPMITKLVELKPIELYLSINSVTSQGRRKLMADRCNPGEPLLERLRGAKLPYHGSLVAMPWIVGWGDVEETVRALDANGAETIRIFMPGYSALTHPKLRFPATLWEELAGFVDNLKKEIATPITLEPPRLDDLRAEIGGIIKASIAAQKGLLVGDVIKSINGKAPFSRVEAFHELTALSEAHLELERGKERHRVCLTKPPGVPMGLVMEYDLSRDEAEAIMGEISRHNARSPLIMASKAGYAVLTAGLMAISPEEKIAVLPVTNTFFGGSIITAGLLVIQDFEKAWLDMEEQQREQYDLLIIPSKAFDYRGQDLLGRSYLELADFTGVTVTVI